MSGVAAGIRSGGSLACQRCGALNVMGWREKARVLEEVVLQGVIIDMEYAESPIEELGETLSRRRREDIEDEPLGIPFGG